jgi:hypothetical protein
MKSPKIRTATFLAFALVYAMFDSVGDVYAQNGAAARLEPGDAPGWTIPEAAEYTAKELYGYIDGGAEMYLEYGFDRVSVQTLTRGKDELVVEIWRMKDADGAFGIFSVSGMDCMVIDTLRVRHCATIYRLMLQHGAYYITITGDLKRGDIVQAAVALGQRLCARMEADTFAPPVFFMNNAWFRQEPRPMRVYKGPIALQNNDPEVADKLSALKSYRLYCMDVYWHSVPVRLVYATLTATDEMTRLRSVFGFAAETEETGVWKKIYFPTPRALLMISPTECALVLTDNPIQDFSGLLKQLSTTAR